MSENSLLVFASGEKEWGKGGSGFANLVNARRKEEGLSYKVVGVVSNHPNGGVKKYADELGIRFFHFVPPKPPDQKLDPKKLEADPEYLFKEQQDWKSRCIGGYQAIVRGFNAEFVALSGWLKPVFGLSDCFNIHPCILPQFGGPGMYGHYVHEAVMAAFRRGEVDHSAVCMHFINDRYDDGPVFFEHEVPIFDNDTPATLALRVNKVEHRFQPMITDYVVRGLISWDREKRRLVVPEHYPFLPKELL